PDRLGDPLLDVPGHRACWGAAARAEPTTASTTGIATRTGPAETATGTAPAGRGSAVARPHRTDTADARRAGARRRRSLDAGETVTVEIDLHAAHLFLQHRLGLLDNSLYLVRHRCLDLGQLVVGLRTDRLRSGVGILLLLSRGDIGFGILLDLLGLLCRIRQRLVDIVLEVFEHAGDLLHRLRSLRQRSLDVLARLREAVHVRYESLGSLPLPLVLHSVDRLLHRLATATGIGRRITEPARSIRGHLALDVAYLLVQRGEVLPTGTGQPLQVRHGARARALTHRQPPDRFVTTALLQPDVIRRQRRDVLGLLLVQQPQRAVQRTRHVIEQFLGVRKLLGHRSDEIIQAVMHVLRRPHLAEGL